MLPWKPVQVAFDCFLHVDIFHEFVYLVNSVVEVTFKK